MLDPNARLRLRARHHLDAWRHLPVSELPSDALRRDDLAVDLQLAGAISLLGTRPQMVLARAIHLGLEPINEGGLRVPPLASVGALSRTNSREVPERCRRPTPRSDPPALTERRCTSGCTERCAPPEGQRKCTGYTSGPDVASLSPALLRCPRQDSEPHRVSPLPNPGRFSAPICLIVRLALECCVGHAVRRGGASSVVAGSGVRWCGYRHSKHRLCWL